MWRRFRSDPLSRLRERLDDFGATRDPRAVLDSGAIRDAEAVMELVTATPADGPLPEPVAEGIFLLACLHWYRYQLLPSGEDADDLGQAVTLTEALLGIAPQLVSPPLLAMLHAHRASPPDAGRIPGPRVAGGSAPTPTRSGRGAGTGGRSGGSPDGEAGALFVEAVMLMAAAENNRDYRGADQAAALLRRAVDGTPPGEPERLHYLSALGRVHRDQFQHLGRRRALAAAIDAHRESLESTPAGDPERPVRLFNLGNVLGDRYEVDAAPGDLDESIILLRDAARAAGVSPSVRAMARANLGQRLRDRWRLRRRPADLDEAVDAFAAARAAGDPRFAALHGTALAERFLRDRAPADRDAAIEAYRAALTGFGGLEPELAGTARAGLATLLAERHEADGDPADLDAAIEAYRAAAAGRGSAHGGMDPDEIRHAVAALLVTRYERWRRTDDITEAVRLLRDSVTVAGEPAQRARRLADLGYALGRGHADLGGVTALRAARDALTEAETLLARADPLRHQVLNNLGNTLRELSDLAGEPALLEPAAVALRAAVAAVAPDAVLLPRYRSNLGLVLQGLFASTQDLATLTEAIQVLGQVTGTVPPGHPDRLPALTNYGSALNRRVELALDGALPAGGEPADEVAAGIADDSDAAVTALREAVELAEQEAEPAEYTQAVATLALAHLLRHRLRGDPAALDEAVRLLQRLSEHQPSAGGDRHRILTNLGSALLLRYRAGRDDADASAMLAAYRAAVEALPVEHPARTMCLSNLATALEAVAGPAAGAGAGDPSVLVEATAALRAAAATESAPSLLRASAASRYAEHAAAAGDLPAALDGYATAIELIDLVAWHGMDPDDQARLLGLFPGLASDAAAVAVALDRPERAVELLEYGRGVLLTRAHDASADLAALRARAPRLAARLTDLQAALDGFATPPPLASVSPVDPLSSGGVLSPGGWGSGVASAAGSTPEQRYDLATRRRDLLAEIRDQPGFADFLRPPPFATLAGAAVGGPVVLVNVAARRCDALVVADGRATVVPLPGLTLVDLVARTAGFLTAIAVLTGAAVPDGPEPAAQRRRAAARTEVGQTLDWLWRVVAAPVLDAATPGPRPSDASTVDPSGPVPDWPRLWWCPTGLLTLLPLHAAGPLDGGDGVLDRVVPSYTASLRALGHARRGVPARPEPVGSALVVGMPQTPGLADLPGVDREVEIVRRHLPRVRALLGPAASPAAVLAALPGQPVAHLSCHGTQDLRAPAWGRLALAGGPLHVRDLWRPAGSPAALAVLSACETVRGGAALPDEALTLGTAFQLAGFRHVIGALWSISDALTVRLCADLYAGLAVPGGIAPDRAAVALHQAVRRLRAVLPDRPDTWAGYAHLGP
ncbi:CHAT domain-containing protein [Micromonospora sp. RHAY321]|uniref:CHAT domain-containing protein n=1 Tax=Micromonospora sp. RHAY321 TaxID=2944807 RepID=UPI00207C2E54|nr:CHAT domain-containing protein [Micromonospora sp. RHAY321]MCO1597799.1 CHAT domain-containing protein [Micromonospora sp. RHAY321]